ncbi:hypothetical protein Q4Q35_00595 [Flavivirga aquimarina]|uniref:Beta-carotene 15,15'-monooxygenase n=1 Tax=Flavivirga aquimarina TaxID=2027862 RepID=A0ABT8W5E2_9FLAO|nr:hypothetical protein [Flavivirga aquimarina]MDO5968292.1 hypothetical protein [Flavivirga aquimarina]
MHTLNSLLQKISHAKSLDFGDIINNSIELFKKVWLKGFLVILFLGIAAFIISLVFQLIGLAPKAFDINNGFDIESFSDFYFQNILYSIPQNILVSTLTLAFVAAFYRICKQIDSGETANDDYFYFLKKEYFTKVFMLGIIYTLIAAAAQRLFLIPYIYVFVPLSYFAVIFAFNPDLSETEIVKASFALGNKKWLITFGTMFVMLIIGGLGILGCGIGILFTISIVYLPSFLIYKDVVGFKAHSEIDKIGLNDDDDDDSDY